MALTTGRAIAIAAVAMVAGAVLLLPPRPRRLERVGRYPQVAANQARIELRAARRAVAVRAVRDSARSLPAAAGTPAFFGDWNDAARTWLTDRVREILGDTAPLHPVRIALLRAPEFLWSPTLFYALPNAPDDPCVAIYADGPYPPGMSPRRPGYRRSASALLGPCAYYARFGTPGPAVRAWLRDGGSALALTSPAYPAPRWRPPPREPWVYTVLSDTDEPWFADQRLAFPLTLEACLTGEPGRCSEFVMGPRHEERHLQAMQIWPERAWALRPGEITWLNDVLVAFGPERFASFWAADGLLPDAFTRAFGEPLDTWTHGWALGRFGDPRRDGRLSPQAAGISAVAAVACLLIAVAVATRRRVA